MTLHLLLPIALLPATMAGELTRRVGVTALIGEIAVGVLLGPSVLDVLPSREVPSAFHELAHIGLCALMFRLGMHSQRETILRAWKPAALVGISGMALSFILSAGVTYYIGRSLGTAIFVGAALMATSLSVPAIVLKETGWENSRTGSIILGGAFFSDLLGLFGLSLLSATVSDGPSASEAILWAVAWAATFIAGGFFLGPFLVRQVLRVVRKLGGRSLLLALAVSYLLAVAYAAKATGVAMVIGAYAAGLAFAGSEEREWLEREIQPLISLFRPLFFVLIGTSISFAAVDPTTSSGRALIAFTGALLVVGVLAKMVGPCLLRGPWPKRRAVGFGMVARGGMGFVFADIGMVSGMLPARLFSAVALTLAATTVIGAVGLRVAIEQSERPTRPGRQPRSASE